MEYVITGKAGQVGFTGKDGLRAYWHILCPYCGAIHVRERLTYWDDLNDCLVSKDSFLCRTKGITANIRSVEPFDVLWSTPSREERAEETRRRIEKWMECTCHQLPHLPTCNCLQVPDFK